RQNSQSAWPIRPALEPLGLLLGIGQPADESPAATEFTDRQHEFVLPFFQRKIDGVVLRVHNAEEARIAEGLRAASAEEDLAIQEDAYVVTVPELQLLQLIAIGVNDGLRIQHLHSGLRLEPFRE